ncbi:MAG: N-formylglutamate amidohydrolase [Methylovulum sp.]|nr:N-formylglutamate amidohydrolase [Methylovulum sp.]
MLDEPPKYKIATKSVTGCANQSFVVTCEHGGNQIPLPYQNLFQPYQAQLATHRGFDLGALLMAKELATALSAPLVSATVSRLLVDLNRSIGHPHLHAEVIRKLSVAARQEILQHYYRPYRERAERLVKQGINHHGLVIHFSSHSFTPELNGKIRNADIGLLYDPARAGEADLCERWQFALKRSAPELKVRRNYPYLGKGDGLTSSFRQYMPPGTYLGIELEINQKHIIKAGQNWTVLRKAVIESLRNTLMSLRYGTSS